jgi:AcrR family transcriptional regulator
MREKITKAALSLAVKQGYRLVRRDDVAEKAGVSIGLVTHYFGGMEGLRDAIVKQALASNNLQVMAEALVAQHPAMAELTADQHNEVLSFIATL